MEMLRFCLSNNKIQNILTKMDQNRSPELLNLLFDHISIKTAQQIEQQMHEFGWGRAGISEIQHLYSLLSAN